MLASAKLNLRRHCRGRVNFHHLLKLLYTSQPFLSPEPLKLKSLEKEPIAPNAPEDIELPI
jgi:hypothetical protein